MKNNVQLFATQPFTNFNSRIIVPALAILTPMILDLSSDSALTASYYSDFSNDTLTNSCITSSISNEPLKVEISWSQIELVKFKVSKKLG